jgi:hypothetical protein
LCDRVGYMSMGYEVAECMIVRQAAVTYHARPRSGTELFPLCLHRDNYYSTGNRVFICRRN